MWFELSNDDKGVYKRLILAFASLSEAFAQKEDQSASQGKSKVIRPIVNSKFQESCFQYAFNASAEDIGNTSFDVAIRKIDEKSKTEKKYLIGIKTFSFNGNEQKVAQFKKEHDAWNSLIQQMKTNVQGKQLNETEINSINHDLYLELAQKIANLRNQRIRSSISNLQGFKVNVEEDSVEYVYHVLMPSVTDGKPVIYVGETDYTQIDVDHLKIEGCTSAKLPGNFIFSDGNHVYKFTPADSQLYMNFDNKHIVKESWNVIYTKDAFSFFLNLAEQLYGPFEVNPKDLYSAYFEFDSITGKSTVNKSKIESYSWLLAPKGEVEKSSGFNSFYGTGIKKAVNQRENWLQNFNKKFSSKIDQDKLKDLVQNLVEFCKQDPCKDKFALREEIVKQVKLINSPDLEKEVYSLVYRPLNEMYIPIPNSREFHTKHPDFFIKGFKLENASSGKSNKCVISQECRKKKFKLIFEPSGDSIDSFITQDGGKGIESCEKQSNLGKWLREGVFQLKDYEPLTVKKLNELEINGIRLYKIKNNFNLDENSEEEVHLEFIWIDVNNPPEDFLGKTVK